MLIYSDNKDLAHNFLGNNIESLDDINSTSLEVKSLFDSLIPTRNISSLKLRDEKFWNYLFIVEEANSSQFDILVKLSSRKNKLPDRLVCIAEKGDGFHGFRNRAWSAQKGNIHLSIFFKPQKSFENFHAALLILSAVSIIETIDSLPDLNGEASTKWVNDIIIGNAKIAGVITQTASMGNKITGAVIGIGLNVETKPEIVTDKFTPRAACLKDFTNSSKCNVNFILKELLKNLAKNITQINLGEYRELYEIYCSRSAVIGKQAAIYSDSVDGASEELIISGKVASIKENLELVFENNNQSITKGRLALSE